MSKEMKVVWGTPWIEVESGWGSRPEGWKLFLDRDEAVKDTHRASKDGPYEGGYIGPERPLKLYEIPFDSLPDVVQEKLRSSGKAFTSNYWDPKYKSAGSAI